MDTQYLIGISLISFLLFNLFEACYNEHNIFIIYVLISQKKEMCYAKQLFNLPIYLIIVEFC